MKAIRTHIKNRFAVKTSGDGAEKTEAELAAEKVIADKAAADALAAKEKDDDPEKKKLDISSLDPEVQKIIKDLRAENGKHRTNNNNLTTKMEKFEAGLKSMFGEEDDEVSSEKKLEALQGNYESMATRTAILELAVSNGVSGAENVEYFEFLMNKKMDSLEEGAEISQEDIEAVLAKCSKDGGKANTGTDESGSKGNKGPEGGKEGETTQEEFDAMGMTARSKLFASNRPLYDKLFAGSNV